MSWKSIVSAGCIMAAASPVMAAEQECRATKAAFLSIKQQMSYDEVAHIVGCPGHRLKANGRAGTEGRLELVWPGQTPGSVLHVTMVDGRVKGEVEDGLR